MKFSTLMVWLAAFALMIFVFSAYALCDDGTENHPLQSLCNANGWPTDDTAQLAYERACQGDLNRL